MMMSVDVVSSAAVEDPVEEFLHELVQTDRLQEAFNLFLVQKEVPEEDKSGEKKKEWVQLVKRRQQEAEQTHNQANQVTEAAIRQVLQYTSTYKKVAHT